MEVESRDSKVESRTARRFAWANQDFGSARTSSRRSLRCFGGGGCPRFVKAATCRRTPNRPPKRNLPFLNKKDLLLSGDAINIARVYQPRTAQIKL
jgi:hypothetical protein